MRLIDYNEVVMLIPNLKRVCELQPRYSSDNTPEMQERGALIRTALVEDLRAETDGMNAAFGEFASDINVEGSDGIGRKTEAPWVRIFSDSMSPSAREGFISCCILRLMAVQFFSPSDVDQQFGLVAI